jgi:D-alanyl-D-alanine-carboxypeptidase/D-alanyl-D-alanine-endopeptidase
MSGTTLTEIDAACAAFAKQEQIPGLAAGIVQDGRLVHVTTVGLADIEASRPVSAATAFRIASMTKNMTALAILSLRDQGRLALDAPLAEYVPQFAKVPPATRDSRPVSLRDLLTHVAGFVTDDPWGDRVLGMTPAELDALIATGRLFARPPGLAFEYSNLGYALLGRVLTNVSGERYQAFIQRTIMEPLGMVRTTFDAIAAGRDDFAWGYRVDEGNWSRERIEPDGEVGAMGGLATTVPDYARYVAFLLSAWPARDEPETGPVRRSTVREMGLWHAPPLLPDAAAEGRTSSPQRLWIRPRPLHRRPARSPAASCRWAAGLWLACADVAAAGMGCLCLRQPDLCAHVAPHAPRCGDLACGGSAAGAHETIGGS